jgi:hypothetical protein
VVFAKLANIGLDAIQMNINDKAVIISEYFDICIHVKIYQILSNGRYKINYNYKNRNVISDFDWSETELIKCHDDCQNCKIRFYCLTRGDGNEN